MDLKSTKESGSLSLIRDTYLYIILLYMFCLHTFFCIVIKKAYPVFSFSFRGLSISSVLV